MLQVPVVCNNYLLCNLYSQSFVAPQEMLFSVQPLCSPQCKGTYNVYVHSHSQWREVFSFQLHTHRSLYKNCVLVRKSFFFVHIEFLYSLTFQYGVLYTYKEKMFLCVYVTV